MQTFIRNARGKALADSPALNANSRRVLISLPHDVPPAPRAAPKRGYPALEPAPPAESAGAKANVSQGSLVEESPVERDADPYSNLDGAFASYVADGPRPIQDVRQSEADDDLLF